MMHIRAITWVDNTDRYFPARHCVSQEKKPYHICIHMTSKLLPGLMHDFICGLLVFVSKLSTEMLSNESGR